MADLERALAEITLIRSQMARGMEFRGLGTATHGVQGDAEIAMGHGVAGVQRQGGKTAQLRQTMGVTALIKAKPAIGKTPGRAIPGCGLRCRVSPLHPRAAKCSHK